MKGGMTIEEIIEHMKSISDALREGFDACGRLINENPNNRLVRVAMEGMQNLCASVALELYATFGIDSRVGGWLGRPGENIAGNRTRGAADAGNGTRAGDGRTVRQMPKWVTRAKLDKYWRQAMQIADGLTRADLETAFAAEYTSRLHEKGGV